MKDQLGRTLQIKGVPQRIVSIVPSQTELLYHLGLEEEVAGITKFCIHPEKWFRSKQRVGGTKNIDFNTVEELNPDIIFANKEENTQKDIEMLENLCPVWVSDIRNFDDALKMIESIGSIVGKSENAQTITDNIKIQKQKFVHLSASATDALYLIWKKPYMAAGSDTFISEMMQIAGFNNVMKQSRYPIVELSQLQELRPPLILLSSEPYPFKQKDVDELTTALPGSQVILVDGELFSWYGSRLLQSFDYFSALHEQIR